MKRIALSFVLWVLAYTMAAAQTACPTFSQGKVLTAGQWQACFDAKQNVLGYTPVNKAGDTMLGRLVTFSGTTTAGFNLPPGSTPSTPANGDLWTTSSGIYVRINGSTVGPLISSGLAPVTTVSNSDGTLTISPTTGAVNASLALAHANSWTALQTFDLGTGSLASAQTGAAVRVAGAAATAARIQIDAFGAQAFFSSVAYGGTRASPAALTSGTQIGGYNSFGYNGSGVVGPVGTIRCFAAETWTSLPKQGTYCEIATTPNGGATLTSVMRWENDGGVTVPSTVTGGDKGVGTINATGLYIAGTAAFANNVSATQRALGRNTAGSGAVEEVTATQLLDWIGSTRGSVIYRGASGWTALTPGIAGTVLTSGGAGADPTYTAVAGTGTVTSVICDGVTITTTGTCPGGYSYKNCTIAESHGSNNVTFAIKDSAGSDPSATSPCVVWFRSATAATGSWTQRLITGASSITLNSGSTLGATNGIAFNVWFTLHDDGSNAVLGVSNRSTQVNSSGVTTSATVYALNESTVQSSTTCSSCATATAIGTFYTTAGVTSKPLVIIGFASYESGLAAAGAWSASPTRIQSFGPGVAKPGYVVQWVEASTSTAQTNTTTTTNATNSAANITLTSAANLVNAMVAGTGGTDSATNLLAQIYRSTSAITAGNACGANTTVGFTIDNSALTTGGYNVLLSGFFFDKPNSTSQQFYTVCINRGGAAGTVSYPIGSANRGAYFRLQEIQGSMKEPANDNINPGVFAKAG